MNLRILAPLALAALIPVSAFGQVFRLASPPSLLQPGARYRITVEQHLERGGAASEFTVGGDVAVGLEEGGGEQVLYRIEVDSAWIDREGGRERAPEELLPELHVAADGQNRPVRLFVGAWVRRMLELGFFDQQEGGAFDRMVAEARRRLLAEVLIFAIEEGSAALASRTALAPSPFPVGVEVEVGWGRSEEEESPMARSLEELRLTAVEGPAAVFSFGQEAQLGGALSELFLLSQESRGTVRVTADGQIWGVELSARQTARFSDSSQASFSVVRIERTSGD